MDKKISYPAILTRLGTCQDLLQLLGKVIFVLESALYRKEFIHEAVSYLLESNENATILIYEFPRLKQLDDPMVNNNIFSIELDHLPPELSWGPLEISFESDDANDSSAERIRSKIISEVFAINFPRENMSSPLSSETTKPTLPILPMKDFELRLSSGRITLQHQDQSIHEHYLCKTLLIRNFISYSGITACFNDLFHSFSLYHEEEIRKLWQSYFPNSFNILLRIFDLHSATFTMLSVIQPSFDSTLNHLQISFPMNMTAFRTHYPFFARLVTALGDTTITIVNAKYPERHLFSIQYQCEDINHLNSGKVTLVGLCSTLTGRFVWANSTDPQTPFHLPEDNLGKFLEFLINFPQVERKEGMNENGFRNDFTVDELKITFHTTIRLNAIIGLWLPNITLSDASFLISPYRGYTSNLPLTEVIGWTVSSLGFEMKTHDPTSAHHHTHPSEEEDLHSPAATSSTNYLSWLSQLGSRFFFSSGFESFITLFQQTFLLTIYLPSSSTTTTHQFQATETNQNFLSFILYFHFPPVSFFLKLVIHVIKYLFLSLRFYFHIFSFLYDFFYAILSDLMKFEENQESIEKCKEVKELNEEKKSVMKDTNDEKIEKKNWYLGRREDILTNRQYNDHHHHSTSPDEIEQRHDEEENGSLLSSIGQYFRFGLFPPPFQALFLLFRLST
jgi:hypothetical protein